MNDMTLTLTPGQAKVLLSALCAYDRETKANIARCAAPDALPTEQLLLDSYKRDCAINAELRAPLYRMAYMTPQKEPEPQEAAAGKFVVTGQCRRELARCETREEAETVKAKIGGYDVIPVEEYVEPDADWDCASWDFSRERIEELAAVVAEDVNDPDPEREWDMDSIGALLAVAGFYGDGELAKMEACKSAEELHALMMSELREAERICNVKIFAA